MSPCPRSNEFGPKARIRWACQNVYHPICGTVSATFPAISPDQKQQNMKFKMSRMSLLWWNGMNSSLPDLQYINGFQSQGETTRIKKWVKVQSKDFIEKQILHRHFLISFCGFDRRLASAKQSNTETGVVKFRANMCATKNICKKNVGNAKKQKKTILPSYPESCMWFVGGSSLFLLVCWGCQQTRPATVVKPKAQNTPGQRRNRMGTRCS